MKHRIGAISPGLNSIREINFIDLLAEIEYVDKVSKWLQIRDVCKQYFRRATERTEV